MKHLFNSGTFVLHSGKSSNFKIDCAALDRESLKAIAGEIAVRLPAFWMAVGVPTGGTQLASILHEGYAKAGAVYTLIVDDVLTTGRSMENWRLLQPCGTGLCRGAVIFARGPCPSWIVPLFQLRENDYQC